MLTIYYENIDREQCEWNLYRKSNITSFVAFNDFTSLLMHSRIYQGNKTLSDTFGEKRGAKQCWCSKTICIALFTYFCIHTSETEVRNIISRKLIYCATNSTESEYSLLDVFFVSITFRGVNEIFSWKKVFVFSKDSLLLH